MKRKCVRTTRSPAPRALLGLVVSAFALLLLAAGAALAASPTAEFEGSLDPQNVTPFTGSTSVSEVSAKANVSSAHATLAVYTVTFKTDSAVPAQTGFIRLQAPVGSVFPNDIADYLIDNGAHEAIPAEVQVNPNGEGENVVELYLPTAVAVEAGSAIETQAYGVDNPTVAGTADKLAVSTSSDVKPVEASFPIAAESAVGEVKAGANTTVAGAHEVVCTVAFTAAQAISNGNPGWNYQSPGYIRLTAPKGTVFSDGSIADYEITDGGKHQYISSYVVVNPEDEVDAKNVVDVYLPGGEQNGFSIAAGDRVELRAYGVANPSSENGAGKLAVSTSSDAKPVETSFPVTAESAVGQVKASANTTSAGAEEAVYAVSFTAGQPLSEGNPGWFDQAPGYIRLTAPAGAVFPTWNGDYIVTDGKDSFYASGVVVNPENEVDAKNVVDVYLPAGSNGFPVKAGDTVALEVAAVGNPESADSAGKLAVSTSSDVKPAETSFPITAESAVGEVKASASTTSAAAHEVIFSASFKASQPLADGDQIENTGAGYIRLAAPTGAKFPTWNGDYIITDGKDTFYASQVAVDPEKEGENVVDVYVPTGTTGFPVKAGDTVALEVAAVANPASADGTGKLAVSTSSDIKPVEASFPITAESAVSEVKASANTTSAGAREVVYSASFKASQPLDDGNQIENTGAGYIRLAAPAGAKFSTWNGDYIVTDGKDSFYASQVAVDPEKEGENVVDVYVPIGTTGFPVKAGDTVALEVAAVANPASADGAGKLAVSTSSDVKPVETSFPITAETAIGELHAHASTTAAGAADVAYTASFKASQPLSDGNQIESAGAGYVRLAAPAGTVFSGWSGAYTISDGAHSYYPSNAVVDPEKEGNNVVDLVLPTGATGFAVKAGDTVEVDAYGVQNPSAADAGGELAVSSSSDATRVAVASPITPETAVSEASSGLFEGVYTARFATTTAISGGDPLSNAPRGYVTFTVPADATLPGSGSDYQFTISSASSPTARYYASGVSVAGQTATVDLDGPVAAGDRIELSVSGTSGASAGKIELATSSDVVPVSVSTTELAPLSGTVTFKGKAVTESVTVQACEIGGGGCTTASTSGDGAFTIGVEPLKGTRYELTATPPAFGGVGSASNAAEGRLGPVTVPGAQGLTGLELSLGEPAKLAQGVTVVTSGGTEVTAKTEHPFKFWGEPYALRIDASRLPKGKRVLVTQVVVHGTNSLTGEKMKKLVDVGGEVDGLSTGLPVTKQQPLTVDMPAVYPMHGELKTTINYRVLRGDAKPLEGVASTQVLDEIYPSAGEPPTDPMAAYFANYGNPAGVAIGPGKITGPDAQYFHIIALSSVGSPATASDCSSAAVTLADSAGGSGDSECGIGVRFTPPATISNAHKVYYRATLHVDTPSGYSPIPVALVGCDARVVEDTGKSCYQGVGAEEEKPDGPETAKEELEEEKSQDEIERLKYEEYREEHQLKEFEQIIEEIDNELKQLEAETPESIEQRHEEELQHQEEIEEYDRIKEQIENEPPSEERKLEEQLDKEALELAERELKEIEQELKEHEPEIKEKEEEGGGGGGGEGGGSGSDAEEGGSAEAGEEYSDPSGTVYVKTADGPVPLAGATVTLSSSFAKTGPFQAVENGSTIMSPANRVNPSTTDAEGHFGWDVLAGYYKVAASDGAAGCDTQESGVLTIPPPVEDLSLTLECAKEPTLDTAAVELSSSAPTSDYGSPVTFTATVSRVGAGGTPSGSVAFYDGTTRIGEGILLHGRAALTLSTLAVGAHDVTAAYAGDATDKPAGSAVVVQSIQTSSEEQHTGGGEPGGGGGDGGQSGSSGGSGAGSTGSSSTGSFSTGYAISGSVLAYSAGQPAILATKLTVSSGRATVELRCAAACSGRLTLAVARTTGKGRKRRTKLVAVGTAAYSLAVGAHGAVRVALSRQGVAWLTVAHGRLAATLELSASGAIAAGAQTSVRKLQVVLVEQRRSSTRVAAL
jgi:hypothetical protein